MAPSVVESEATKLPIYTKSVASAPLQSTGALNEFDSFDVTPVIGREFPRAKLVDWLNAPNSDDLIRDLAVTSKCL